MNKKTIVLISGKAGVGKTTTAKILSRMLSNLNVSNGIFPFASELKKIARQMGWDGEKDDRGRQLLIDLGLAGRRYDEDMWAKLTARSIIESGVDVAIVDDWRFPNEGRYISTLGYNVLRVRVVSPNREILKGTPQYLDASETSLPDPGSPDSVGFYDAVVDNVFDLSYLEGVCCKILMGQILSRV